MVKALLPTPPAASNNTVIRDDKFTLHVLSFKRPMKIAKAGESNGK